MVADSKNCRREFIIDFIIYPYLLSQGDISASKEFPKLWATTHGFERFTATQRYAGVKTIPRCTVDAAMNCNGDEIKKSAAAQIYKWRKAILRFRRM
jgi:hypothetical protein